MVKMIKRFWDYFLSPRILFLFGSICSAGLSDLKFCLESLSDWSIEWATSIWKKIMYLIIIIFKFWFKLSNSAILVVDLKFFVGRYTPFQITLKLCKKYFAHFIKMNISWTSVFTFNTAHGAPKNFNHFSLCMCFPRFKSVVA